MPATRDEAPADVARRILDANDYLTLATADPDGRPWATPVWFAERDLHEFLWVSRPDARHSQNLAQRPEVALVVFDSTVSVGDADALYVEATATEVAADDLAAAIEEYSAQSVARGIRSWQLRDVTGTASLRLYRAVARERYVLEGDRRIPVE